jgi:hypothetical protein
MNADDIEYVDEVIASEGFDYAFVYYTDFNGIQDGEFHKLRKAFLQARNDLISYLGADV